MAIKIKTLQNELKTLMERIAKNRDSLDELIADAEGLRDNCNSALIDMNNARDSLSEMV